MEGVDQKTLYVGLSKSQALAIQEGKSVFPEESSNRFGLRESPMAALERANRFWEWHVSHHDPNMGPAPEAIASNEWMLGEVHRLGEGQKSTTMYDRKHPLLESGVGKEKVSNMN